MFLLLKQDVFQLTPFLTLSFIVSLSKLAKKRATSKIFIVVFEKGRSIHIIRVNCGVILMVENYGEDG